MKLVKQMKEGEDEYKYCVVKLKSSTIIISSIEMSVCQPELPVGAVICGANRLLMSCY